VPKEVVPNANAVPKERNGLKAMSSVGWPNFCMNSCCRLEEMNLGTQISHKEFIKKIAGDKISLPRRKTSGENRKNA